MRSSVSILDTSPLSVACITNTSLNISKLKTLSSEVLSGRDWYKPRKKVLTLVHSGSAAHKLRCAVSCWKVLSVAAHGMLETTMRDNGLG